MVTEAIGWTAAAILLTTLVRQVYVQWRDRNSQGVSRWPFVGECAASLLFVVYSWLLGSWVFVVTNMLLLVTAMIGEAIYLLNRRAAKRSAKRLA